EQDIFCTRIDVGNVSAPSCLMRPDQGYLCSGIPFSKRCCWRHWDGTPMDVMACLKVPLKIVYNA
ncbi:MAG: hypothetical protein N3A38_05665, partial [Planctomycetota bacterium]|nr:hypothetical protein [Planctomycetota bacterium]